MSEQTIILTAAIAFSAGSMSVGMWLGARLARVTTDRNRLQAVVNGLREQIGDEREMADRHDELMTDKIAQLTSDSMELQRLAHKAQDGLDMAKGMIAGEIAAHKTTKRQLAAAKGQITKLRKAMGVQA